MGNTYQSYDQPSEGNGDAIYRDMVGVKVSPPRAQKPQPGSYSIAGLIEDLNSDLDRVNDAIDALGNRVSPFLRKPEDLEAKDTANPGPSDMSDVGRALIMVSHRIRACEGFLVEMRNRVDL